MSLFKKSCLKKLRADLIKEHGYDVSDEDWNEIVREIEAPLKKELEEKLPKVLMFSIFKMAENNKNLVIEIDGVNIGAEIRRLQNIYEWLQQKKIYFGW